MKTWEQVHASITYRHIRKGSSMKKSLHIKLTPIKIWVIALCVVAALGASAGLIVFTKGLAVTNLSDLVPWG